MIISALYEDNGLALEGLSPTISIMLISDGSLIVTDAAMSEVSGGYYSYDFTGYTSGIDYAYTCDGGAGLIDAVRYIRSGSTLNVWEEVIEGTYTAQDVMKLVAAASAGKLAVSGNTVTIRDLSDSLDRITATTDSNGQRTAVTHVVS